MRHVVSNREFAPDKIGRAGTHFPGDYHIRLANRKRAVRMEFLRRFVDESEISKKSRTSGNHPPNPLPYTFSVFTTDRPTFPSSLTIRHFGCPVPYFPQKGPGSRAPPSLSIISPHRHRRLDTSLTADRDFGSTAVVVLITSIDHELRRYVVKVGRTRTDLSTSPVGGRKEFVLRKTSPVTLCCCTRRRRQYGKSEMFSEFTRTSCAKQSTRARAVRSELCV